MEAQSSDHFGSPVSSQGLLAPNSSPSYGFPPSDRVQPNVLSRALEATIPNTVQQPNTTGFVRPHQAPARPRRSSAVHSMRPNRPRNMSQNHLDEINDSYFPVQSYNYNQENGSYYQNNWSQQPTYDQQRTSSQVVSYRQQVNYGPQNSYNQESVVADEHVYLQQRLYSLAQLISAQTGVSPHVVAALTAELRDLSQRHIDLQRNLRNEHRIVQSERERLGHLMASQQQLIQNAISERDRACEERDRVQAQFVALQGRQRDLERKLEEVDKNHGTVIDTLHRQIRFRDEQLNAKRSLWLANHKNSGARQISEAQDPYATPTARHIPRTGMGYPLANKFVAKQSTPGPSNSSRFPTNLPTNVPKAELPNEFWPYHDENAVDPGSRAESGQSPLTDSNTVIPFKTEDEIAQEFREEFDTTYGLIEAWVQNYAHTVNDISLDQRLSHDEDLWPFMLSCTYTNFTDAHDHVILLLRNPATRSSFVMRMIIQYLYLAIWRPSAFKGFGPKYAEKLDLIEFQLTDKDILPKQRANLIGAQTHCIQCIVESKRYLAFRSQTLSVHAKALRAKLGPLLDAGVPRANAGRDLSAIAVSAFDLSARLYTSNFTFLFNFPTCGKKFLHPSMECDDPKVRETALELHIRQAKVKLAIKPLITMRNDRNLTITAKKILNGHVLIFP